MLAPMLPDNAPFTPEQRAWLNGFFAGLLSLDGDPAMADAATGTESAPQVSTDPLDDGDDGEAPWHDQTLPIDERMTLAEGRPLRRKMMAAMAQQHCGQCGYTCEDYSNALFLGEETRQNLCVRGGKATARMLKKLAAELGLANQLAAHMGFAPDEVDRVRRFWNAPNMATQEGLKAVDLFEAIAVGKIRALWVMATNPAVSLPRADAMRDALGELEVFVVSDCVASNDTIDRATIRLPASAWGEKDGTVTSSERRISR